MYNNIIIYIYLYIYIFIYFGINLPPFMLAFVFSLFLKKSNSHSNLAWAPAISSSSRFNPLIKCGFALWCHSFLLFPFSYDLPLCKTSHLKAHLKPEFLSHLLFCQLLTPLCLFNSLKLTYF